MHLLSANGDEYAATWKPWWMRICRLGIQVLHVGAVIDPLRKALRKIIGMMS